jgi:tRNA(fMet)-specific endonuclease VapC
VAFLFDTDVLSEVVRRRPAPGFLEWLATVDRADQFTSAVTIGEMFKGAFKAEVPERHLRNLEQRLLPSVTVLPFDLGTARMFGDIQSRLELAGTRLEDLDLQIAATAIQHGMTLVTGNIRHFARVPGLSLSRVLADARTGQAEAP